MKRTKGVKPILGIRVDPAVMSWLRRKAAASRRTVSDIARDMLHAGFDARHAK
jgi:hypothetical protein